jgi:hypothetical protein
MGPMHVAPKPLVHSSGLTPAGNSLTYTPANQHWWIFVCFC